VATRPRGMRRTIDQMRSYAGEVMLGLHTPLGSDPVRNKRV